jgi:hypothetical protein
MFADTTVSIKTIFDVLTPVVALILTVFLAVCGVAAYFFKRLIAQVDTLTKEIKPIRPAIIELQGLITNGKRKVMFGLTVEPGSPLKITEYGDQLLRDSGFYKILRQHSPQLTQAVKDTNPKTNYDIQENSEHILRTLLEQSEPMLVPLKSYAFTNGLSLEVLIPPATIALRDEVMKTLKLDK